MSFEIPSASGVFLETTPSDFFNRREFDLRILGNSQRRAAQLVHQHHDLSLG
jgi:hypothetical protein